jgi:hypothetical protein
MAEAELHIHLCRIEATLARIENKLDVAILQEKTNMAAIDDLTAEVTRNTTVEGSALALIQGFAAQLAAAGTDPVKLQALQTTLKANDDQLAAAVAANTPAA